MPFTAAALVVPAGESGKVYMLSSGTRASWGSLTNGIATGAGPSLTEITSARNVTLNTTRAKGDGSSRVSSWKTEVPALKEASIDIEFPWQPTDAGQIALAQAYFGDTTIPLAILDGPSTTSGTQGLWADFLVDEFSREEPIDKEMMLKVKLVPATTAVVPQWVKVA